MNLPTLLAAEVLSDASPITIGFGVGLAAMGVLWGETRVHVSGLREWVRAYESKISGLETRLASAEVREGRLVERFEALVARLDRMEGKLDQLLARKEAA